MSDLFGRIAVKHGFATREQIQDAVRLQEDLLKHHVRKPLGQILIDQNILTPAQVQEVMQLQKYRNQRGSDKKLAELAVEYEFVAEAQVQDALAFQKEYFRTNGITMPLEELLVQRGHLSDQHVRALKRALKRLRDGAAAETMVGVKECAQCLEYIPHTATQCPRCKFVMGKLELKPLCKLCQAPLEHPGEYCHDCGANRMTGMRPAADRIKSCPSCRKFNASYQTECTCCGYSFVTKLEKTRPKSRAWAQTLTGLVVPFLVGAAIVWLILNWQTASKWVEGDSGEVRRECGALLDAIQYRDLPGAAQRLAKPAASVDEIAAKVLPPPPNGFRLKSYRITRIEVAGNRATVYVDLDYAGVNQDLLSALKPETKQATLYWRKSDRWRIE